MDYQYQNFLKEHDLGEFEGAFKKLFRLLKRVKMPRESHSLSRTVTDDSGNKSEITDTYDVLNIKNEKIILKYYADDQYNIKIDFLTIIDNKPLRKLLFIYLEDDNSYSLEQDGKMKNFPLHPMYIIYLFQRLIIL
jgi:hypothetical protein